MPWGAWFVLGLVALGVIDQAVANICNTVLRRRRRQ